MYTHACFAEPFFHAMTIIALMAISTGTTCALFSSLHCIVRSTPFPAAAITPIGPLRLSTQPGMGSKDAGVTLNAILIGFIYL